MHSWCVWKELLRLRRQIRETAGLPFTLLSHWAHALLWALSSQPWPNELRISFNQALGSEIWAWRACCTKVPFIWFQSPLHPWMWPCGNSLSSWRAGRDNPALRETDWTDQPKGQPYLLGECVRAVKLLPHMDAWGPLLCFAADPQWWEKVFGLSWCSISKGLFRHVVNWCCKMPGCVTCVILMDI